MWKPSVADTLNGEGGDLVIVTGNCQAHYLAATLAAQGAGLVCVVGRPFGFMPQARGVSPFFAGQEHVEAIVARFKAEGHAITLVEQTSPVSEGAPRPWLDFIDAHVRFPHIELQSLWPHLSPSEKAYEPDRIRRRWALDLAALRRSEEKAGWDTGLTDYIEASLTSVMLMHTFNHPAGEIMGWLHGRVSRDLGLDQGQRQASFERIAAEIRADRGISFMTDNPLRQQVIDALELSWAREGWCGLWGDAVSASMRPDMVESLRCLQAALALPGCDPHVRYSESLVLEAMGDLKGSHRAIGEAYRAYPGNRVYAERWLEGFVPGGSPFRLQNDARFEWA